jgi:hypothetical protein
MHKKEVFHLKNKTCKKISKAKFPLKCVEIFAPSRIPAFPPNDQEAWVLSYCNTHSDFGKQ